MKEYRPKKLWYIGSILLYAFLILVVIFVAFYVFNKLFQLTSIEYVLLHIVVLISQIYLCVALLKKAKMVLDIKEIIITNEKVYIQRHSSQSEYLCSDLKGVLAGDRIKLYINESQVDEVCYGLFESELIESLAKACSA